MRLQPALPILLVCCWAALGAPLQGQTIPLFPAQNKWEVSFFAGLSALNDDSFTTPVEGGGTRAVELGFDSSYLVGARITENLGSHFGAELEYTFANQPLAFGNLSTSVPRLDLEHHVHKLSYSILIYAADRRRRIRPFGSVGVGASFYQISSDSEGEALQQGIDLKDQWKFAFSFGGGTKIQLARNWGIRFDFRNQLTGVPDFELPAESPLLADQEVGPGFRPDGTSHNWQLSAGFMYTFRAD